LLIFFFANLLILSRILSVIFIQAIVTGYLRSVLERVWHSASKRDAFRINSVELCLLSLKKKREHTAHDGSNLR
jgi:hypothetical protein